MDVLMVTLFCSLLLVLAAIVFFAWNVATRNHEHVDRLAILPLQADHEEARNPVSEKSLNHVPDSH